MILTIFLVSFHYIKTVLPVTLLTIICEKPFQNIYNTCIFFSSSFFFTFINLIYDLKFSYDFVIKVLII